MEGIVTLQLSAKSVGMFEAFYNSLKPIQLVNTTVEVAPPGKLPDGTTEIPFEVFFFFPFVFVTKNYVSRSTQSCRFLCSQSRGRASMRRTTECSSTCSISSVAICCVLFSQRICRKLLNSSLKLLNQRKT